MVKHCRADMQQARDVDPHPNAKAHRIIRKAVVRKISDLGFLRDQAIGRAAFAKLFSGDRGRRTCR
jgi:hypothetical protein